MIIWRRAAIIGLIIGGTVALIIIALATISAHRYPTIWLYLMDVSMILFPTHIFLLPLAESVSFPHDLGFYFLTVLGNGIIYSIAAQLLVGLYITIKKVLLRYLI